MKNRIAIPNCALFVAAAVACLVITSEQTYGRNHSATPTTISSTIPANGDVNPYGVVLVPRSVGKLVRGNILVSNFNNSSNLQGTGTTIVQINPETKSLSLFAQIDASSLPGPCPGGVGLTTALGVLRSGWVIVGSLPTSDGTSATAQAGCLLVLDSKGKVVKTIADSRINGPWDMTTFDGTGDSDDPGFAVLFVTNVLNGTVAASGNVVNKGTVLRILLSVRPHSTPHVDFMTVIGSGFSERTDPAALVIGPTGVALSRDLRKLYVADTVNSQITAIDDPFFRFRSAGTGSTVTSGGHLNAPLGMTLSRDGNILTVNGGDGFLVETSRFGTQIFSTLLDNTGTPPGAGALFGLIDVRGLGVVFVDDASNTLNLFSK